MAPWVFVGEGVQPFVGIGGEPMTDEEFAERVEWYEAQFEDGKGSVERSGLYRRVAEPKASRAEKETE